MPASPPQVLPDALRMARKSAGLSQAQVAEGAGISPGYVAMIELGKRQPTLGVVISIAQVLKVPVSTFAVVDKNLVKSFA